MTGAVLAEQRKITSTKLWWILLIVVAVFGTLYAGLYGVIQAWPAWAAEPRQDAFTTPAAIATAYNGGNTLTRILALVIGVMAMGAEYRYKTMSWSYLAEPRRLTMLGAKAVVVLGIGLVYGAVSVGVGVATGGVLVAIFGGSMLLGSGQIWASLVLGVLSLALWALMGMGIGILIKNMVVAMLVAIGFAYMIEPALSLLFTLQQWDLPLNLMPSGATSSLIGLQGNALMMGPTDPFAWWQSALVLLAWAAVPTGVGIMITIRKDVE